MLSKHGGSSRSPSPTPTQGPKRQPSGSSAARRFVHAVPHNARASSRFLSAAAASRRPGAGVAVSISRDGLRSGDGGAMVSASSRCASRFVASSNARCIAEGCAGRPCHRSPSAIGCAIMQPALQPLSRRGRGYSAATLSRGTNRANALLKHDACSCTAKTRAKHELACQRHTSTAQLLSKTGQKKATPGRWGLLSTSARHLFTAHDLCSAAKLSYPTA